MRISTALPLLLSSLTVTFSLPLTSLTPSDWQSIKSSLHFPSVESTLEEAKTWIEWEGKKNDADDQKTIWQLLNEDSGRYSKLLKAIEIEGGGAKSVLDNRDMSITFFAPEDSGIPDPHHGHDHDHDHDEETAIKSLLRTPTLSNILHVHSLHSTLSHDNDHDGDDDEEKKKRRRIFKYILGQVLKYHGLPEALTGAELAGNKSVATALYPKFGSNDGQPLRIHLEKKLVPPSLELNFYAKVVVSHSDRKAINGYLHEISHPLLPPPSILDESFLSRKFDTFTTALQKVKGEGAVAWQFSPELSKEQHHPVFVGAPAVTAFIPTNAAFALLPEKLQFFLFSPFGQNVLAKILSYHVLDKYVVFTESIHKDGEKGDRDPHDHHGHHGKHGKHGKHHHHHDDDEEEEHEKRSWFFDEAVAEIEALGLGDDNDPSFHLEEEFPTLLSGGHLKVVIDKSKVLPVPGATKVTLSVNGIEAEEIDIPSLNGVFHVIPEVLKPPHKHEDDEGRLVESGWEDWEEWLVQWADSQ